VNPQFLDQLLDILERRFLEISRSLTERFLRAVSQLLKLLLILCVSFSHRIIPSKI
jgi:hypothetical protein